MKRLVVLFAAVSAFVLFVGCTSDKKRLSGNPSEVLDADTYNKLQQKYRTIKNFQEGTAIVKVDKYGLIDGSGKEILPCEYDTIYGLRKFFRIIVKDSLFGATNVDGQIIKQCTFTNAYDGSCKFLAMKSNDKWGFIDDEGRDITQYKYEEIWDFNDTTFIAKYDGFYGVSDYQQNTLIPFQYDRINYKWDKQCPVTVVKSGDSYGLYNSKNQKVLDCEYEEFYAESSGYVALKKNSRMGLVEEETGKIMIPFEYKRLGNFSDGMVQAENLEGKCGYLDVNGKEVLPFIYDICGDFSEGLAAVLQKTGKYTYTVGFGRTPVMTCGYIDKKGNVVIPFKFQHPLAISMCEFHEGLAAQGYSNNNMYATIWGYINKKGDWVVQPKYDQANYFEHGVAQVVKDEKYGYINKEGEEIIPCKYDKYGGWFVNDSTIRMTKDDTYYYFNLKGKSVPQPEDNN